MQNHGAYRRRGCQRHEGGSVPDAAITSAGSLAGGAANFVSAQVAQTKAHLIESKDIASAAFHKIGDAMPSITQKQALVGATVAATAVIAAPIAIPLAGVAAVGAAAYGITKVAAGQTDELKQDAHAVSEKIKGLYKPAVGLLEKLSAPAPEQTAKLKMG